MATAPSTPVGYEFTTAQNVEFKAAAYWMGIMGRLGVLFSLLYAAFGAMTAASSGMTPAAAVTVGIVLLAVAVGLSIAVWTIRAASAFGRVATTAGRDIENVMVAVANLKSLYRLQAVLIGLYFGLIVLYFALNLGGAAASR